MELPFVKHIFSTHNSRSVAASLAVVMAFSAGCRHFKPYGDIKDARPAPADGSAAHQPSNRVDQSQSPFGTDGGEGPSALARASESAQPSLDELLASDDWISPVTLDAGAEYRWRHAAEAGLMAAGDAHRAQLYGALQSPNEVIAANATIVLGRFGEKAVFDRLAAAVHSSSLREPQRCAAAEVLARFDDPRTKEVLRESIERNGTSATRRTEASLPKLHATLIRGLARHVDPADDVRFREALKSPVGQVRRAALAAWAEGKNGHVPIEAIDLRTDSDQFTRVAALDMIARRNVPRAIEYLTRALADYESQVKLAAVAGLGEVNENEARDTLRQLLQDRSERIREAAVVALARQGDVASVLTAAEDKSWRVRRAVAAALADWPTAEASTVVAQLLEDRSTQVQQEVVNTLVRWPLEGAGPLLLEVLEKSTYAARLEAADYLKTHWPPAAGYAVDAPPERRGAMLADLRTQWTRQFGDVRLDRTVETAHDDAGDRTVSPQRLEQVAHAIASLNQPQQTPNQTGQALARLDAFGEDLIPALSQLVRQRGLIVPERVYRDVLPRHSDVFETLARLVTPEVAGRRVASARLVEQAADNGLGPLEMERLATLVITDPDELVWRNVLSAIANESEEPAARIAYAALSHPDAEVRRRGCIFLEAHPSNRHAPALVAALADRNGAVQRAAAAALGRCGELPDPAPLESFLNSTDETLQLLAARSLTMLGHPSGNAALERMLHHPDHRVRRGAAAAVGELGPPQGLIYVPTLIGLLDDRLDVRHAALESLEKIAGRNVAVEPGEVTLSSDEVKVRWQRWWESRQQTGIRAGTVREAGIGRPAGR